MNDNPAVPATSRVIGCRDEPGVRRSRPDIDTSSSKWQFRGAIPLKFSGLRVAGQLTLAFAIIAPAATRGARGDEPERASRYDIATREDLLFAHLLTPLLKGEVPDWPILGGLGRQIGGWVDPFLDARQIVAVITEAFPVEGQPALLPLRRLVADCARTLGLPEPAVQVRNSPFTQAYAVHAFDRDNLALTSGLLDLFAERPEELKFVVGHELGHVKCDHLELKQKAFVLLSAVQAISLTIVPDRYQAVLPTLALGRLYTWCRESEVSADRAGLLCCGDPKVAYVAIMRLQHGL